MVRPHVTNQLLGYNEVFWGDGKVFEIQSTMHVFREMAIWGDGSIPNGE